MPIAWLSLNWILERSWVALSSVVFQCVSVSVSVSPDQIATFSNIYRHTSPFLSHAQYTWSSFFFLFFSIFFLFLFIIWVLIYNNSVFPALLLLAVETASVHHLKGNLLTPPVLSVCRIHQCIAMAQEKNDNHLICKRTTSAFTSLVVTSRLGLESSLALPLLSQLSTIVMVTISMRGKVMVMMLKIIMMETTFIV